MELSKKEKKAIYDRAYKARNRERRRNNQHRWYEENKERVIKRDRFKYLVRREKDPVGYTLSRIKAKAKKEGKEFNLTRDDIMIPKYCPVLGIELKFGSYANRNSGPSVDRIDNTKGYVKGNIGIISMKANMHKSDMSIQDVERLLAYMKGEI